MFSLNSLFSTDKRIHKTLSRISSGNIKSLSDIRILGHLRLPAFYTELGKSPEGFEIQYSNNMEERLSKTENIPNWKYYINQYNFRGRWNLDTEKKLKIACFGDSFTFGDGIPEEEVYVERLRYLIDDAELYNVGKGGSSIERVARTFAAFVKFVKIDIAIFTLPHVYREYFIDDAGNPTDLIPVEDSDNHHAKYMEPFFAMHDNYQLVKLSLNINYILDIANLLGIKVLFTTWDQPTYDLLKICAEDNAAQRIFPNDLDVKQARDKQHPGKMSHQRHAKNIMKELHDRTWI